MSPWNESDIPDLSGRTVLVTGANSGLGLRSARVLAAKGARVLLGCRDTVRGQQARREVTAEAMTEPELVELDLADLGSVYKAADHVRELTGDRLDVLMNNAGVMATPRRHTQDGFELQIGTNHLGHAALTWLLMPALRNRPGARVVTLSSLAHHGGNLDTSDLNFRRRRYSPLKAYSQSKLANLLFTLELDRRARSEGLDLTAVAAHPGMTSTELAGNSVRLRRLPGVARSAVGGLNGIITQPVQQGALPQLLAATAPGAAGGDYYGPSGPAEVRGHPKRCRINPAALHEPTAARLWETTAELTGIDPAPR